MSRPKSHAHKRRSVEEFRAHLVRYLLREARKDFRAGNNGAILRGMSICLWKDAPPAPQWLANAFQFALMRVSSAECMSWDEVFGRPYKKNAKRPAIRAALLKRDPVWMDVRQELVKGAAIGDPLFRRVGLRHRISGALAQKYYYAKQALLPPDFPKPKRKPGRARRVA